MAQASSSNLKRTWFALYYGLIAGFRVFKSTYCPGLSKSSFEPLTPVLLEDDRFTRYEQELLGALNNDEVLNIALTGGYGAGKSSVVKTFFERNPQFPYVTVSLATFSQEAPAQTSKSLDTQVSGNNASISAALAEKGDEVSASELLNRIEETIVQQLLYSVRADQLPKTRLKRIAQASNSMIFLRTSFLAAWLAGVLRLCVPKLEKQADVDLGWIIKGLTLIPEWIAASIVVAGGIYMVYGVLRFLSMFSIDGLTLKGGKLEATHHGSVLHKNVDEIIYCFERSDVQVVVIEDLDRFDIQDIFFRLREINFIIRQSLQIKRSVHFLYAIRDELFTVTDKTKFFDLIIPIIPVVNSENSREKLTELIRARKVGEISLGARLDPAMVETVCYYIDEMRLIKNIVNEYDIYSNLLAKDGLALEPNKLFAIVVLRNLHPDAYTDLIKRRGPIYNVLIGFAGWVKDEVQSLEEQADELRELLARQENEVATSTAHLRACVWYEIVRQGDLPNANAVSIPSGALFTLQQFVEDGNFDAVIQADWVKVMATSYYGNAAGNTIRPSQLLMAAKYKTRADLLQRSVDSIEGEINDLRRQIVRLKTTPFREAARKGYGPTIANSLAGLEVVTYLMRRGFFDTDYVDYLGYFYEGSLTQADKNFILALGRGEMLDVTTPLQNPERVASKLDFDCLEEGKGIIAGVIAALATHREVDSAELATEKLAIVLKSGHKHLERMAEAVQLLLGGKDGQAVIKALFEIDQNLMHQLLQTDRFGLSDARQQYISAILDALTAEQLNTMRDKKGLFLKAINGLSDIAQLLPSLESKRGGWNWLRDKPAQFRDVSDATSPDDLKKLVAWGCLELSLPMLRLLWQKLGTPSIEEALVTYGRLESLELPGLSESIKVHPEAFITELLSQDGVLPESSDSLVKLLHLVQDDPDLTGQLLDRTQCLVSDLREVPKEVWPRFLDMDRVEPLGRAVWTVFDQVIDPDIPSADASGDEVRELLKEKLLSFVKRHVEILAGGLWQAEPARQAALQVYLLRQEVPNGTLRTLFADISLDPAVVLVSGLPPVRWDLFAYSRCVPYALEIREAFKAQAPRMEPSYIRRCWKEARADLDLSALPVGFVWELTRYETASIRDALTMWQGIPFEAFDTCEGSSVELAKVCGRANVEGVSFSATYLPVILQVIQDGDLSRENRIEMIIQALTLNCEWERIAAVLVLLGDEYPNIALRRRVHLPNSEEDKRLVEALGRRNFVGGISHEKKHIVVYRRPSAMK
ncbi:hypothetical protein AXX04_13280 [Pseudomonas aeruginosa]|uniref:YobI family P-loop NTPase n=1 Tax=Pseudomonas aeruginosa TaxID=287 RepID=UPI000E67AB55|nr:hypothetical protein [Pseudomonas aeruginosa]RIZ51174.1 hypothetical protein AXX04_13280 [Pseudomonas aeruginosa]